VINLATKEYANENGVTIMIDLDVCVGSGECVAICPASVYELEDGKAAATNVAECIECCACVSACPTGAIKHTSCE